MMPPSRSSAVQPAAESGTRFLDEPAEVSARTANVSYVTAGFLPHARDSGAARTAARAGRSRRRAPRWCRQRRVARVYSSGREVWSGASASPGKREIVACRPRQAVSDRSPRPHWIRPAHQRAVGVPARGADIGRDLPHRAYMVRAGRIVRAADRGAASQALVRSIVASDPLLPVSALSSMSAVMADAMAVQR